MNKTEIARGLRKRATGSELVVWEILRGKRFQGFKFRRQHVIQGFVADFYCHELKLALEVDGGIHERQKEYDAMRQEVIEREDISVLRIDNVDSEGVLTLLSQWLDHKESFISSATSSSSFSSSSFPTPSPAGRERAGVRA